MSWLQGVVREKLKRVIQYFRQRSYKDKKVVFFPNAFFDRTSDFEGKNRIGPNTTILNTNLGVGSYVGASCFFKNTTIGRYCSIGNHVVTIAGRHPLEFVSTHPVFYSMRKQVGFSYVDEEKFEEFSYIDSQMKKSVIIGNDVWICSYVKILEGVIIGDGAVIGAGALVTKNVPPYAVVGGVPAKIIKYRFDDEIVEWLMQLAWWNREPEWLRENADVFDDPRKLRERIGERET